MSQLPEIYILSAARTAVGDYGGALKDFSPSQLGSIVIKEAISRAKVDAAQVDHGVIGNVIHTEGRDMYVSRVACLEAGMSHESQAMTLNRLCGSGLQSIISAAQMIAMQDANIAVAGGVESMSRAGFLSPNMRFGARMGDTQMIDLMVGALTDPFDRVHMGLTAENIAEKWKISREDQDAYAAESHRRAVAAQQAGHFKDQIVAIEHKTRKGMVTIDQDEHPRADVNVESLAKLKPAFKRDASGTVTAGNASSLNDGAAAVILANAEQAKNHTPLARLVSYGIAGVDPKVMGEGPIPAVAKALARAGLKAADMDVIESNEAFAAQALCVSRGCEFDPAKVNPNGGAIALGHPLGATGAILTVKALYELQRIGGRYALVTMCIGGGQGIAAVFERA